MNRKLQATSLSTRKRVGGVGTLSLARILVPVDFSAESARALRYADVFARRFGASHTLLHVVEPIVEAADFGYGPVTMHCPNPQLEKSAHARLTILARKRARPREGVAAVVRSGIAETEIVKAAKDLRADLIIMGTRGKSCPEQTSMGSTAEKVIRQAPCPVLVVRKPEHEFVLTRKSRYE